MKIRISPASRTFEIYRRQEIEEGFHCSYELNPTFESALKDKGLRVVGRGEHDEARIVELSGHRFFVATLFQPQLSSVQGAPHPLITAFLNASLKFRGERAKTKRRTHRA